MENELKHHGIVGQKWGKRNGPPYPLDDSDLSYAEKKAQRATKYTKKIQTKLDRDDASKRRSERRLLTDTNAAVARGLTRWSARSDRKRAEAGSSELIENRTYSEAKGLANAREGTARRAIVGAFLAGPLGAVIGTVRGIKAESYVRGLDRDERGHLLDAVGQMKDPGRALAVVNLYRKIDKKAQTMTPAERDRYFDLIKEQLND